MATAFSQPFTTGRAAESAHWYSFDADGNPVAAYEVPRAKPGKNGETHRPAHVGDAKKLKLLTSFSGIWKVRANPQLDRWKQGNAIMAALTSPRLAEYRAGTLTEEAFLNSILDDAEAEGKNAADDGTQIHTACELAVAGQSYDARWHPQVEAALAALTTLAPLTEWTSETLFASREYGYGGRVDVSSQHWVVDFKSCKPWADGKPAPRYDSWAPQLAAYAIGLGAPYGHARCLRLANVVVSRGPDARAHVHTYTDEEHAAAEREFHLTRRLYLQVSGLGEALGVTL